MTTINEMDMACTRWLMQGDTKAIGREVLSTDKEYFIIKIM